MAELRIYNNFFEEDFKSIPLSVSDNLGDVIDNSINKDEYTEFMVECYDSETGETFYAPLNDKEENESLLIVCNNTEISKDYQIKENDIIIAYYLPQGKAGWTWAGIGIGNAAGTVIGGLIGLGIGLLAGGITAPVGLLIGAAIGGTIGGIIGGITGALAYDIYNQDGIDTSYDTGKQGEKLPDVRGAENQLLTGNTFPYVMGKHLVTPFIIGTPYTTYEGENGQNAVIREMLAVGYAPLKLTDFKLGDILLAYNRIANGVNRNTVMKGIITQNTGSDDDIFVVNESMGYTVKDVFNILFGYIPESDEIELESGIYESYSFNKVAVENTENGYSFTLKNNDASVYTTLFADLSSTFTLDITFNYKAVSNTSEGDIISYWKNNNVSIEILQQPTKDDIDYGTIYPSKAVDTAVNASMLFVIDGTIAEVAEKKNITYKGQGFINGLRTNRVQFTEACPLEFTVNIDMPQGLYQTYSDRGNTAYGSIPLWTAIQWRFYSDTNDASDEKGTDSLGWNNFLPTGNDDFATYESNFRGTLSLYNNTAHSADIRAHKGNTLDASVLSTITFAELPHQLNEILYVQDFNTNHLVVSKELYKSPSVVKGFPPVERIRYKIRTSCSYNEISFDTFETTFTKGFITGQYINIPCYLISKTSYGFTTNTLLILAGDSGNTENDYTIKINDQLEYTNCSLTIPFNGTNIAVGKIISNFDVINKTEFPSTYICNGWLNKQLLNFQAYGGEDGLSEMRASFTCKLNLESCKKIIQDSNNSIKGIEVRAIRVSPNYLNMTNSWGVDNSCSPIQYSDNIVFSSLVTKTFDENKLTKLIKKQENNELDNGNEVTDEYIIQNIPEKLLSESDMRKLCLVAIKATADVNGTIQQQMKKINCIAESFSPFYNNEKKMWFPNQVSKQKKYFEPTNNGWSEITKSQYEADRGNGGESIEERIGSTFANDIQTIALSSKDNLGRYILHNSHRMFNDNNVASSLMLSLVGKQNGSASLGYEDLNILSFIDLYNFCEAVIDGSTYTVDTNDEFGSHLAGDYMVTRFEANGYIYQGVKLEELINKLCICGRSIFTYDRYSRIRIIIDQQNDYPKGVISQQNCISGNNIYTWAEKPAGFQFQFNDENDGYETNSFYCWADHNSIDNYKGEVQSYNIDYVTNPKQLWSLGRYILACSILQRESLTRQITGEGELYDIGDVLLVQDDSLLLGDGSGYVQEILEDENYIYGFISDSVYSYRGELDSDNRCKQGVTILQPSKFGKSRAVTLRLAVDGTSYEQNGVTYTLSKGQTNVCLFESRVIKNTNSDPSDGIEIKYNINTSDVCLFGNITTISQPYKIAKIQPKEDGTFQETLIPYFDELYAYGAPLPSFQSKVQMPPAEKDIFELSETPTNINEQNNIMSQIANSNISGLATGDSELIQNPNAVTSLSANAIQDFINLSWSFGGTGLNNTIQNFHVYISRDSGENYTEIGTTGTNTFEYKFNRTVDGYPEKTAQQNANHNLASYRFKVIAENTYGKLSSATICSVTDTNYGTWIVSQPLINKRVSGRNVTLTFSQPSIQLELYGNIRYKVSIKRYDDSQYYKPDDISDPRASEDNYKDTASQETYIESGDMYQQVLPLEGQNDTEPLPVDTQYIYSVCAYNETTGASDSTPRTVNVIALGTSAADIVASSITTNKLSDDCVTADKIHAATITGDKIATTDLSANGATLGRISGEGIDTTDPNNFWNLDDGEFRIGDESQYFHAKKVNGVYQIEFKVGNFELSSMATALDGTTYIYDNNATVKTERLELSSNGITLQKKVNNTWQNIGYVNLDADGNMFITNESNITELPKLNSQMPYGSVVYHLDTTLTDMNDLYVDQNNSKNLVFDGTTANLIDMNAVQSNRVFEKEIQIPTVSDDFCFWVKKQFTIGEKRISYNGTSVSAQTDLVKAFNDNASTSWGLTSAQVSANLAKYEG